MLYRLTALEMKVKHLSQNRQKLKVLLKMNKCIFLSSTAWEVSTSCTHSERCEFGFCELSLASTRPCPFPSPVTRSYLVHHPPPLGCKQAALLPLNKLPSITPKISL